MTILLKSENIMVSKVNSESRIKIRRRQPITTKEYGPDPVDIHVGKRLKLRRRLMKLSQEQLGEAVRVTFQQIQKYERGHNRVSASRLYDIASVLGVDVSFFFKDIGQDVTEHRPTQNLLQNAGLGENPMPAYEQDPLSRNETMELVRLFWKLPSTEMRRNILELLNSMSRRD
ncbi:MULTISPECIES: helix-turn-helix domain-containing protein [unclassified Haematospirillum]|uniref:helix-turn-helix domain-containing protein n=1 Tax=unclassified Haematospirillum TaxID=2622088 RepID=UPI001FD84A63|nr:MULTISPECIES: helix-turn-helix transcriptional regulator [unclassified Haematospirillum]